MPLTPSNRANVTSLGTIEQQFSSPVVAIASQNVFAGNYNQSKTTVSENTIYNVISESQAIDVFGNSQIARMAKYYFKANSAPIKMIPLTEDVSGVASVNTITFTNTATKAGVYVLRAGSYLVEEIVTLSVAVGDTADDVATQAEAAVNAITTLPVSASSATGVLTLTAKTKDITSDDLVITLNQKSTDGDKPEGLTDLIENSVAGSGIADITPALNLIKALSSGRTTAFVQPYDDVNTFDEITQAVGNPNDGTELYSSIDYRPFNSFVVDRTPGQAGLTSYAAITSIRKSDCVNVFMAAPDSPELSYEIASLFSGLISNKAEVKSAEAYFGLSTNVLYGPLDPTQDWTTYLAGGNAYDNRDYAVQNGITPLSFIDDTMELGDVVTPWLPDDNQNAPFKYVVNQRKIWNMRASYFLYLDSDVIKGKPIVSFVSAANSTDEAISTSTVDDGLAVVTEAIGNKKWIYDKNFTLNNTTVVESTENPDRFVISIPVIVSGNLRQTDGTIKVDRSYSSANIILEV